MDRINTVLDEIILIQSSLKKGHTNVARALMFDFIGDVNTLERKDYASACLLLWLEKAEEYGGSDIYGYHWNPVEKIFQR